MTDQLSRARPLSLTQLNRLRLVFSSLREFHDGFVHVEQVRLSRQASPALMRFLTEALTMKLDGFYQDRKDGLLAVLRLVNCNPLADNIEAALDTHIGSSTFYQMQNDYRDKNIAHPQFRMNLQADFVDRMKRNLTSAAHIEAFCNADDELKACTAAAYVWLADHYPQLLEDANAADRLVDNPPSSEI